MEAIVLFALCAIVAFAAIRIYIDRNKKDAGGSPTAGFTHEDSASK